MDKKKVIKDWIVDTVDFINYKHNQNRHDGFRFDITDQQQAYLFYDKAISKRISKRLSKKYNIKSDLWESYDLLYSYSINVRIEKEV